MGTLFVVATPIGNVEDLSPRALRVLSEVSLIAAEDTRHTGSLLKRLGIETPMVSNHGFNERSRVDQLLDALGSGDVALVSDSGTPAVSDPGAILVHAAAAAGFAVVPIPGPSAVVAAVSASGLVDGPFSFLGFLPRAKGERESVLRRSMEFGTPFVVYESGTRIGMLASELSTLGSDREVAVFRELTKLYEEAIRSRAADLPERLAQSTLKGEFTVVVGGSREESEVRVDVDAAIRASLERGERVLDIAKSLAKATGHPRSDLYERVLEIQEKANAD